MAIEVLILAMLINYLNECDHNTSKNLVHPELDAPKIAVATNCPSSAFATLLLNCDRTTVSARVWGWDERRSRRDPRSGAFFGGGRSDLRRR